MSELNINIQPQRYYIHEKATYDAMLAAGEIIDGVEYWIKETGEIYVFDGKFGGGATADSVLSDESENPVQNKVIKAALDNLTKEVVDNEQVTALAFNKVREEIQIERESLVAYYYDKEQVNNEITKVENKIIDNEEVTAAAINDLKATIRDLQNQVKALKNA